MTKRGIKVPIAKRAVVARINRKLKHDGRMLKTLRGYKAQSDLGDYYVVDLDRNMIIETHVDPEAYGREIGVLEEWEVLSDD